MVKYGVYILLLFAGSIQAQSYVEPIFDFGYNVSRPVWPTHEITGDTLFHFSTELGNIWQPDMQIISLFDETEREKVASWDWFDRQDTSRQTVWNGDSLDLFADGVMQTITLGTVHPWFKGEFLWSARLSVLKGRGYPLVDDGTIEAVHSLLGDEDPFGRKVDGLNQAGISWTDWDGNKFSWRKGEWKLQSIDLGYRRSLGTIAIDSTDVRLKFTAFGGTRIPLIRMNSNVSLHSGLRISVFGDDLASSGLSGWGQVVVSDGNFIQLSDSPQIGGDEFYSMIDVGLVWIRRRELGVPGAQYALSFHHRGPWIAGSSQRMNYGALIHQGYTDRQFWNSGAIALYNPTQYWVLSWAGRLLGNRSTIYLMEDLRVHNLPDFQIGIKLYLGESAS